MKKIINFYFRHRKLALLTIGALAGITVYVWPEVASAAADADLTGAEGTGSLVQDINEAFNVILQVTSAWLWPVILMIGSLLDNDLIFGGAMGERLLGVWVQIRNLVNIIFVLVLLAIAIYNVLPGVGEEAGGMSLGLKTALPKFVLALIAVNFSFVAAKVVLDFTNVITGAVFALPAISVDEGDLSTQMRTTICGTSSGEVPMKALWCEGGELSPKGKAFFSKLDRQNITVAYAIRFGRAVDLKFIKGGLKDLTQLAFNVIFNVVLYVVYAVSYIVLFVVLLFRVVVLWVGVVLSPLLALGIVLPNFEELAGGAGAIKEKFIANAIAPIKIGLVLSVGYIMLDGFEADKTIHGGILAGSSLVAVDPNALPTDISDLQQLMIAVAVVVIIWVGVFEAAEKTAASGITGFIKGHLEDFGKWAAKLPTYATVIPVEGGGGKRSLAQIFDKMTFTKEKWTQEHSEAPERRGYYDTMAVKNAKTPEDLAKALRSSTRILTASAGVIQVAAKAGDLGDRPLAAALKGKIKPVDIARAVFSQSGEVATAIKKEFGTERDLANAIEREKAMKEHAEGGGEGKKDEGDGSPADTEKKFEAKNASEVTALLSANEATVLAGQGAFKNLKAQEDVQRFKDLTADEQTIIINLGSDGFVENYTDVEITAVRNAITKLADAGTDKVKIEATITDARGSVPGPLLGKVVGAMKDPAAKKIAQDALTSVKPATSTAGGPAGQ